MTKQADPKNEIVAGIIAFLNPEFRAIEARLNKIEARLDAGDVRFDNLENAMNARFDALDQEIARVNFKIYELDDKISAIADGQEMIREILEARITRIEDILDIESAV